jgi:hypothetical protein
MACSKFSLSNTGSTAFFNYRKCENQILRLQSRINTNQTKTIWLVDGSYSTPFTNIDVTNDGVFPPVT